MCSRSSPMALRTPSVSCNTTSHHPSTLSGIPDRLESRGLIRDALNIPQPSLCLDVACEDVGVGLWLRDVLAMTRL
jgi:hypothetical protein